MHFLIVALVLFTIPHLGRADDLNLKGFQKLFNGKDLTGWKATRNSKVWTAEDGMIVVKGGGGGFLMTEETFSDFELYFQWRTLKKKGNSGVALRAPLRGDPSRTGMEIQLIDDLNWKGLRNYQHTGSIYGVVPAAKISTKPVGQWNAMRIIAKGPMVKVIHNGVTLVDADISKVKPVDNKNHPGLKRKSGHVGFQSYNIRIEFRKVMIKKL
ncbi:MAG: DUF1080 domain-containing protein [Gemmataceae bacterium]